MKIENRFTIDAPVDKTWTLLTNMPEITPCLPGANLTDEQDGVYSGNVRIKVGPVTAEYRGHVEFVERDNANYRVVIDGTGRDSRSAANGQALITAQLRELGDQTEVDLTTELKVTGRAAQFGSGVMQDVSEKLVRQFADCLTVRLEGAAALDAIDVVSTSVTDAQDSDAPAAAAHGCDSPACDSHGGGQELDLLGVAGGAVFRRVAPAALVVIVVLIVLFSLT